MIKVTNFVSIQHATLGTVLKIAFTSNFSLDCILQPTYVYQYVHKRCRNLFVKILINLSWFWIYIAIYTQASGYTHIRKICYIEPLAQKLIFTLLQKALLSPQCLYPLYLGSFEVREFHTIWHIQTIFLGGKDQQNCTAFPNNKNSFRNPSTSKIQGPAYTQC